MYQVGPSFGPERDLNNQADRFDLQGCVKQVHISEPLKYPGNAGESAIYIKVVVCMYVYVCVCSGITIFR
jgi:hypothetical protein